MALIARAGRSLAPFERRHEVVQRRASSDGRGAHPPGSVGDVDLTIRQDDLTGARIAALLREHLEDMRRITPPESVYALDLDELRAPEITFWSAWDDGELVGCGALKELDARHGEIKSMRTARARRRRGVAARILEHIIEEGRRRGYESLSLETGSTEAFGPARALYAQYGFERCGPFGEYGEDPHSLFMTKAL